MDDRELYPAEYEQERKAFLSQVEAHLDRNELQAALNLAEARLKRTPGDLDARIVICRVWLQQGRIDEVREMLHEMEEIIANFSQIYACMGDIYMKKGMEDSAEPFYRKFMVLNPGASRIRDILEKLKGIEDLHGTHAERETEGDAGIPSDFQTVTLAELYIRQGHLRSAEELLEKIVGQEPQNGKAAGLLQEVRGRILGKAPGERHAGVISELSRWLDNIGRVRGHAA
ncbi:MAG: tetratricopeptide repeat protein [Deltaproteobacteria bacterium]|nr:tetratricopeptide repeat protein [Deltaproteobacteria bacterium]